MIIRSVTVDEKVIEQCQRCPRNFVDISNECIVQHYYNTNIMCRTGILETGMVEVKLCCERLRPLPVIPNPEASHDTGPRSI